MLISIILDDDDDDRQHTIRAGTAEGAANFVFV
jgi:hypothetical protein